MWVCFCHEMCDMECQKLIQAAKEKLHVYESLLLYKIVGSPKALAEIT